MDDAAVEGHFFFYMRCRKSGNQQVFTGFFPPILRKPLCENCYALHSCEPAQATNQINKNQISRERNCNPCYGAVVARFSAALGDSTTALAVVFLFLDLSFCLGYNEKKH